MAESKFEKRVAELQNSIDNANSGVSKKERCIPTMVIAGVIVPFLVIPMLYFLKPSFVQKQEGDKYIRNNTKVFCWGTVFTVLIWVCMYLFSYCRGYSKMGMLCSRKS